MKFKAILDPTYTEAVRTVSVTVATIRTAKDVSSVMRVLSSKLPVPSLHHLKRVKRVGPHFLVVLDVAPTEQPPTKRPKSDETLKETLGPAFDLLEDFEDVLVPAEGPRTRAQFEKCLELWPVNFHPEQRVEMMLRGDMFTPDEQAWHVSCMERVVGTRAALVADPARRVVVAEGQDQRADHPLHHEAMVVVDAVAGTQRGGGPGVGHLCTGVDAVAGTQRGAGPGVGYLCTGWDVYLGREPCPMCAMALVHSRVARVFFGSRDGEVGALVSRCQVQSFKSLNHHYQVFEVDQDSELLSTKI